MYEVNKKLFGRGIVVEILNSDSKELLCQFKWAVDSAEIQKHVKNAKLIVNLLNDQSKV